MSDNDFDFRGLTATEQEFADALTNHVMAIVKATDIPPQLSGLRVLLNVFDRLGAELLHDIAKETVLARLLD